MNICVYINTQKKNSVFCLNNAHHIYWHCGSCVFLSGFNICFHSLNKLKFHNIIFHVCTAQHQIFPTILITHHLFQPVNKSEFHLNNRNFFSRYYYKFIISPLLIPTSLTVSSRDNCTIVRCWHSCEDLCSSEKKTCSCKKYISNHQRIIPSIIRSSDYSKSLLHDETGC